MPKRAIRTDPPELVNPSLSRSTLVTSIAEQLQAGGIVVVRGELGSGKTQLLKLIVQKHPGRTVWLNIPRTPGRRDSVTSCDLHFRAKGIAKPSSVSDRYDLYRS